MSISDPSWKPWFRGSWWRRLRRIFSFPENCPNEMKPRKHCVNTDCTQKVAPYAKGRLRELSGLEGPFRRPPAMTISKWQSLAAFSVQGGCTTSLRSCLGARYGRSCYRARASRGKSVPRMGNGGCAQRSAARLAYIRLWPARKCGACLRPCGHVSTRSSQIEVLSSAPACELSHS